MRRQWIPRVKLLKEVPLGTNTGATRLDNLSLGFLVIPTQCV